MGGVVRTFELPSTEQQMLFDDNWAADSTLDEFQCDGLFKICDT